MIKYSESGKIEDYKLWIEIIKTKKFKFANIGSVLLKYRKHLANTSLLNDIIEEIDLKQSYL